MPQKYSQRFVAAFHRSDPGIQQTSSRSHCKPSLGRAACIRPRSRHHPHLPHLTSELPLVCTRFWKTVPNSDHLVHQPAKGRSRLCRSPENQVLLKSRHKRRLKNLRLSSKSQRDASLLRRQNLMAWCLKPVRTFGSPLAVVQSDACRNIRRNHPCSATQRSIACQPKQKGSQVSGN